MVAIVGESGSGKSMTALAVMKLLPPDTQVSGTIFLDNPAVNITEADEKKMRSIRGGRISMIFQEPMTSLNPLIRCGDQVMESVRLHKKSTDREEQKICTELFEKTGLLPAGEMMRKFPHQLSGGQRQRIMIAMALAGDPCLLIADEPTTALDPIIQHSILQLIRSLQKELKLAVMLITHNMGVAADFSDRMVIMKNGTVLESGPTGEILNNPRHPYSGSIPGKRYSANASVKISTTEPRQQTGQSIELIRVDRLNAHYLNNNSASKKIVKILDDVSFNIKKNEILGLVGESGSGKTTLARMLAGLMDPASGSITIEGKSLFTFLSEQKGKNLGRIQLIFQDPYGSLNPRLTIGSAIREVLTKNSGQSQAKAIEEKAASLLKDVGLKEEFLNRYPHELSGGQRQRTSIARALACSPLFMIFDESLSALDTDLQDEMLGLIHRLQQEFLFSALFISHDLDMVSRISTRILVMQQGKLVEEASSERFFEQHHHAYTQMLIEAMPGRKFI